jgi:hypothetical protein
MSRAASMCNAAMALNTQNRTRGFDIIKTIVQIANLPHPSASDGFEIRAPGSGAFIVLADPARFSRPA